MIQCLKFVFGCMWLVAGTRNSWLWLKIWRGGGGREIWRGGEGPEIWAQIRKKGSHVPSSALLPYQCPNNWDYIQSLLWSRLVGFCLISVRLSEPAFIVKKFKQLVISLGTSRRAVKIKIRNVKCMPNFHKSDCQNKLQKCVKNNCSYKINK